MKRIMLISFVALLLGGILSACQSDTENQTTNSELSILSQMQENHIKYVGDNSGVGKLLGFLPQFDQNYIQNMFALQTTTEPYGITIYYEPTENASGLSMNSAEEMTTYAGYLFECIDNLGYVEYAYRKTPSNNVLEQSEYTLLLQIDRP